MSAKKILTAKKPKPKPKATKRVGPAPIDAKARQRVERLYWRAGFGALPRDVNALARQPLPKLVNGLLTPKGPQLSGPPAKVNDQPIDPLNEYGHDVLWWLDRAVRGRHPLVERMTLNWHDHFGVSNDKVGDTKLMLRHYTTLRKHSLKSFRGMAHAIVHDHAMQRFLDLSNSHKREPNENFARELFELFTLGVNNGYTERDIREAARAFTGFTYGWNDKRFGFDRERHDDGVKVIFGKRGRFNAGNVIDLAINHPRHAPYMCKKLWGYFTPRPCPPATLRQMVTAYTKSRTQIRPVLSIILRHPALYADLDEPDQVKPPLVFVAGMLRKTGQFVTVRDWVGLLDDMGQKPFHPPNVNGWDQDEAWMSTASARARFQAASRVVRDMNIKDGSISKAQTPKVALERALATTGTPWVGPQTRASLQRFARTSVAGRTREWEVKHYFPERQRVLRHMLLSGPDAQVC